MSNVDQRNLRYYIDAVSFTALDTAMFLDSHPGNKEATHYFHKYNSARNQALKEYNNRFGPLMISQVNDDNFMRWVNNPWPWEMEG